MAKDAKVKTSEEKTNKKVAAAVPAAVDTAEKTAEAELEEVKKEEQKKVEPKKEVKKETAAPVKKVVAKTKKPVKEPMVPELFVQYDDPAGAQEAKLDDIVAKVKAAYVAEGHRESSIKSLKIYLKPQEWKAYYVINNKTEGLISLF